MNEPTLFPPPPATGTLTERQRFIYERLASLRSAGDGLDADEAGALLHERRGKHSAGVRCSWCSSDGNAVLKALRKRGLVSRRRGGVWVALGEPEPQTSDGSLAASSSRARGPCASSSGSPSAEPTPWPEGF